MKLLILDADGVFMDELPYWRTALAVALLRAGIEVRAGDWEQVGEAFIARRRVQRVTKGRGCNSNWDLAAVMSLVLEDASTRAAAVEAYAAGEYERMADVVIDAMEVLWKPPVADAHRLTGFGIDRRDDYFRSVVADFQPIFEAERDIGWAFDRHALLPPAEATRAALRRMARMNLILGVCTSRNGEETIGPMAQLDVLKCFSRERIITNDEVKRARRETGLHALAKPHWFPLACAMCGYEAALAALQSERKDLSNGEWLPAIYVGDTPADFDAAVACRGVGLPVTYVHINARLCDEAVTRAIGEHEITMLVADSLIELAGCLEEGGA